MSRRAAWLLSGSVRLYRLLLWAYPRAFRRAFGPHMAQVFRDCGRAAIEERGLTGLLQVWRLTLGDLLPTLLTEHRDRTPAAEMPVPAACRDRRLTRRLVRRPSPRDRCARFTDRARTVLELAQAEARRCHHDYLGTEHLVLGLVAEGGGVASRVLVTLGVPAPQVRAAIAQLVGQGPPVAPAGAVRLTLRTKRVLELAVDEARRLNHDDVGTEHLLLGLLREGEGVGAGVLTRLGVDLVHVRAEVLRVLDERDAER